MVPSVAVTMRAIIRSEANDVVQRIVQAWRKRYRHYTSRSVLENPRTVCLLVGEVSLTFGGFDTLINNAVRPRQLTHIHPPALGRRDGRDLRQEFAYQFEGDYSLSCEGRQRRLIVGTNRQSVF